MKAPLTDSAALSVDVTAPLPTPTPIPIDQTSALSPSGLRLSADSRSILLNGKRVLWTMGEFHYSRYPESEWRTELLRMKAGGIDVVSTYVFWIHHEERKGEWVWTGQRDLRRFVVLCKELGLFVFVRGGPWDHGEVRNGGLPDWLQKSTKTRTDDPAYLDQVKLLYGQIAKQLRGLYWAQGGPVIGFQVENEWGGAGAYLSKLKQLSVAAGIRVPFYTRTGWPQPSSPVPNGELFPMYGGYPVGFWDRGFQENASAYDSAYGFTLERNPDKIFQGKTSIAPEMASEEAAYPYLATEIGAGMHVSYHRRLQIAPNDIGSLALCKLGSGCNLMGYYMYHGGTNPDGFLTYLNETQATGYWNDVPVKTYDFQTALGEFGQERGQYDILRRMHLFLHDFGSGLASMPAWPPDPTPSAPSPVRWMTRSNGDSGYIFVNNYQRSSALPAQPRVQFHVHRLDGDEILPENPVTIPSGSYFFWPFDFNLDGVVLRHATAQPICVIRHGQDSAFFFAKTDGIPAEFAFDPHTVSFHESAPEVGGETILTDLPSGLAPAVSIAKPNGGTVSVYLVSQAQSLELWKGDFAGRQRVVISGQPLYFADGKLVVGAEAGRPRQVSIFPPVSGIILRAHALRSRADGRFQAYAYSTQDRTEPVDAKSLQAAGPAREVKMGSQGVAEQPSDADFAAAAVWRLTLPAGEAGRPNPLMHIRYSGDVARLYLDGKLIADNFYNGKPFDLGLARFGPAIYKGELLLKVLPLRKGAPIYLAPRAKPNYDAQGVACSLEAITVTSRQEITLVGK